MLHNEEVKVISIRLPISVHTYIAELAKADRRSVRAYISNQLEDQYLQHMANEKQEA